MSKHRNNTIVKLPSPGSQHCHPVLLVAGGRETYLLRYFGGPHANLFATSGPHTGRSLIAAPTRAQVHQLGTAANIRVSRQETCIDLDALETALVQLRQRTRARLNAARVALEGWHALEDLSQSLDLEATATAEFLRQKTRPAYEKIFFANTIPSRIYGAEKPFPSMGVPELLQLRVFLLGAWRTVSDHDSQLPYPTWDAERTQDGTSLSVVGRARVVSADLPGPGLRGNAVA